MEPIPQRIVMLVLDNGTCPVQEWLSGLRDPVTRARITRQIDKLSRGNFGVRRGVGDSVSELKLDFGPGYRVYYGQLGRTMVILLGGGDKGNQTADIAKAQSLWKQLGQQGIDDEALLPWITDEEEAQPIKGVAQNGVRPRRKKKSK